MEIAKRLQSVRKKLDLSQSQAAKAWGINVRTLQTWEQGQRRPRGFALTQLESFLDQQIRSAGKPRNTRKRSAGK